MAKALFRLLLSSGLVTVGLTAGLVAWNATQHARAQGYNVDAFVDAVDALPGDGRCETLAGECTLRAAIQEANAQPFPSTITLSPGTYALTIAGIDDNAAAGDLDIRQQMTIEGGGNTVTSNEFDHLIEVHDVSLVVTDSTLVATASVGVVGGAVSVSSAASLTLDEVTIQTSSTQQYGGAIYSEGAINVRDSSLIGNNAGAGGGAIFNNEGTVDLVNAHLTNNDAIGGGGGAIFSDGGPISMQGGSITESESGLLGGAGIYANDGSLELFGVTLSNNDSAGEGGAILNENAHLTIVNSSIHDNSALALGGGIYSQAGGFTAGSLSITDSSISSNTAFEGAGLYNDGLATVSGTTFHGNTASPGGSGGAINNDAGTLTVTNSTLSENSAPAGGGGIHSRAGGTVSGSTTVVGSTIASNTGGDAGGIYLQGVVQLSLTVLANDAHNCAGTGTITSLGPNLEDADTCDLSGPGDLINADPALGPLADNGGPTLTHALLAGSDAIDAGADCPPPATDQRGAIRPADGNADTTAACDIGAYEAGVSPFTPTPSPSGTPVSPTSTPDPLVHDSDQDGCADGEEAGKNEALGGLRNPKHFWDFYDVPTGDNPIRDQSISALDFFALIGRFGATGDPATSPFAFVPAPPAYHTAFDRGPTVGPNLWDLTPPDGSISGMDFFAMLAQFGHSCA
jgi:CSLREA domain-containing protein